MSENTVPTNPFIPLDYVPAGPWISAADTRSALVAGEVTIHHSFRFVDRDPDRIITVPAETGERDLARRRRFEGESPVWGALHSNPLKRRSSTHYTGLNRKQRRAIFRNPRAIPNPYGPTLVSRRPGELGEEREVVSPASEARSIRAGMFLPGVHGNYAAINTLNQH